MFLLCKFVQSAIGAYTCTPILTFHRKKRERNINKGRKNRDYLRTLGVEHPIAPCRRGENFKLSLGETLKFEMGLNFTEFLPDSYVIIKKGWYIMDDIKLLGLDKDGNEKEYSIADFKGKRIVLYFYPKDNTSGCTQEACDFKNSMNRLGSKAEVIGVSPDSLKSHHKFREKQGLNFILLSDTEHKLAEKFEVWKEKSMYGRKYMGIERSTFVISPDGKTEKEWRKVKVNGHVDEVLAYLEQ